MLLFHSSTHFFKVLLTGFPFMDFYGRKSNFAAKDPAAVSRSWVHGER